MSSRDRPVRCPFDLVTHSFLVHELLATMSSIREPPMPLTAILDNNRCDALTMSDAAWSTLRSNYRRRDLHMACCGAAAIPKRSVLGTRFFAHQPSSKCSVASGESDAHLHAKVLIAAAASDVAGWEVIVEAPGTSADGRSWVADVLCRRKQAQVAFEVQLSQQSLQDYLDRQERYNVSDVRACWLVRQSYYERLAYRAQIDRSFPMFGIDVSNPRDPKVCVDARVERSRCIPLATFIQGALTGQLTYSAPQPGHQDVLLELSLRECYQCGRLIRVPDSYRATCAWDYEALLITNGDNPNAIKIKRQVDALRSNDDSVASLQRERVGRDRSTTVTARCPYCEAIQRPDYRVREALIIGGETVVMQQPLGRSALPPPRWVWRPAFEPTYRPPDRTVP